MWVAPPITAIALCLRLLRHEVPSLGVGKLREPWEEP